MKFQESEYIGYDGIRMHLNVWQPDDEKPRALLIGIHGLGGHGMDLRPIGEYFAQRGLTVFAPDMRGFGHYSGRKGHIMNFDEYIEDIDNLVVQVKDRSPTRLTYLMGVSLGGLNVIRYIANYQRDIDGLILNCPAVSEQLPISTANRFAVRILSLLNVKKYLHDGVFFDKLSRDPEAVKAYEEDDLRQDMVTPRFAYSGLKAKDDAFDCADRIHLPVLFQQAGTDYLVVPDRNKEFFDNIAAEDKTWFFYKDMYHDLLHDIGREQVFSDIEKWLEKRLTR